MSRVYTHLEALGRFVTEPGSFPCHPAKQNAKMPRPVAEAAKQRGLQFDYQRLGAQRLIG